MDDELRSEDVERLANLVEQNWRLTDKDLQRLSDKVDAASKDAVRAYGNMGVIVVGCFCTQLILLVVLFLLK